MSGGPAGLPGPDSNRQIPREHHREGTCLKIKMWEVKASVTMGAL